MIKFSVSANIYKPQIGNIIGDIINVLRGYDCMISVPEQYGCFDGAAGIKEEDVCRDTDFLIVLGGDGTVIDRAKKAAMYGVPVIGVNLGRVGYLSAAEADQTEKLRLIFENKYAVSERMMLEAEFNGQRRLALNDVVVAEVRGSRMINTEISVNGEKLTEYASSALIVSTPTGSSGFNMSAGGPVIDPGVPCMILTPVCPHNTPNRSAVFAPDTVFGVVNRSSPEKDVYLTLDGFEDIKLTAGAAATVRASEKKAKLVTFEPSPFPFSLNKRL